MWYVGLDVHHRTTSVCILDELGHVIREETIRSPWPEVVRWLRGLQQPVAVCYEASLGAGYLHDALAGFVQRVEVAHPGRLRLIFRSNRKNDRVDARKLAKLLFLDEVPVVHMPTEAVRNWRGLVEYRVRLVSKRTGVKNALRSILRTCGVCSPKSMWTRRGRAWLETVELPSDALVMRRTMLLDEMDHLQKQIETVELQLDHQAHPDDRVELLKTIPGVGQRTAEAFLAYVDDPRRFRTNRSIGSYLGLAPRQDASGGVNRLGRITREGPATVRRFLTEAAWLGILRSERIRSYFQRIQRGQRERTKPALVATAHYLARVMLAMLKTGEVWREQTVCAQAA